MSPVAVLACISLLLAAAAAQAPKPCTVPPLMSGGITVMGRNVLTTGTISYDAFGQRMRVRNFGAVDGKPVGMEQLMLFSQNVYYDINWKTFSCRKKPLDSSFVPMQVPADAQLMGQAFLGSSSSWGMGVLVNTWYGSMPNNGTYSTVFTEIGCIPLTITGFTPSTGWMTISTFNWVIGNSNPMDFHPPFICAKSDLEETDTPDTVFTALDSLAKNTM